MIKRVCVMVFLVAFGASAASAKNSAGMRAAHTWKEVEALGVKKKHIERNGLVSGVEFDLSKIKNCEVREFSLIYAYESKKPSLAVTVPIAEINGKYKFTAHPEHQPHIFLNLKCRGKSYTFLLIE